MGLALSAHQRLSVFRTILFSSAFVHFAPTLLALHENYSAHAFRVTAWAPAIGRSLTPYLPEAAVAAAVAGTAFSVAGAMGYATRRSAAVVGASWYSLASINSLHTQTLALSALWAMLLLWAVVPGGKPVLRTTRITISLSSLIQFYFFGTLFFSGIEKVMAGWPWSGSMYRLQYYPEG